MASAQRPATRVRVTATAVVALVCVVAVLTGRAWPTAVDDGGPEANNPIGRYGPHWLFPVVAGIVVLVLLTSVLRTRRAPWFAAALTAFAAGGASNLAQWVLLGGVSNPIGLLPGPRGSGYASIGDACLWAGVLLLLAGPFAARQRRRCRA